MPALFRIPDPGEHSHARLNYCLRSKELYMSEYSLSDGSECSMSAQYDKLIVRALHCRV